MCFYPCECGSHNVSMRYTVTEESYFVINSEGNQTDEYNDSLYDSLIFTPAWKYYRCIE